MALISCFGLLIRAKLFLLVLFFIYLIPASSVFAAVTMSTSNPGLPLAANSSCGIYQTFECWNSEAVGATTCPESGPKPCQVGQGFDETWSHYSFDTCFNAGGGDYIAWISRKGNTYYTGDKCYAGNTSLNFGWCNGTEGSNYKYCCSATGNPVACTSNGVAQDPYPPPEGVCPGGYIVNGTTVRSSACVPICNHECETVGTKSCDVANNQAQTCQDVGGCRKLTSVACSPGTCNAGTCTGPTITPTPQCNNSIQCDPTSGMRCLFGADCSVTLCTPDASCAPTPGPTTITPPVTSTPPAPTVPPPPTSGCATFQQCNADGQTYLDWNYFSGGIQRSCNLGTYCQQGSFTSSNGSICPIVSCPAIGGPVSIKGRVFSDSNRDRLSGGDVDYAGSATIAVSSFTGGPYRPDPMCINNTWMMDYSLCMAQTAVPGWEAWRPYCTTCQYPPAPPPPPPPTTVGNCYGGSISACQSYCQSHGTCQSCGQSSCVPDYQGQFYCPAACAIAPTPPPSGSGVVVQRSGANYTITSSSGGNIPWGRYTVSISGPTSLTEPVPPATSFTFQAGGTCAANASDPTDSINSICTSGYITNLDFGVVPAVKTVTAHVRVISAGDACGPAIGDNYTGPSLNVLVERPGDSFPGATNSQGIATITGVPAGPPNYNVSIIPPSGYSINKYNPNGSSNTIQLLVQ